MTRAKSEEFDPKTEKSLEQDPWLARIAEHNWLRRSIRIAYGKDIFASGGLDNGTERLLRLLAKPGSPLLDEKSGKVRILDVGCGAGALGITLARGLGPDRARVVMTDRDRLAVRYARANARLDRVSDGKDGDAVVLDAGLGYEPALAAKEPAFDYVVTNVPASVGDDGLYDLVYGAGPLLKPGGYVALVYVIPLDDTMTAMRKYHADTYGPVEVVAEGRGKEHVAQLLRFPKGLQEFESDDPLVSWRREDAPPSLVTRDLPPLPWYAVNDVPEFDTPHFETPLLTGLVEQTRPAEARSDAENVLVLNPRHGLLACSLAHARHPRNLGLLSRDTLEVAVSLRNVGAALSDWQRTHETRVFEPPTSREYTWLPAPAQSGTAWNWIVGHLNWKEGQDGLRATLQAFQRSLAPDGLVALACRTGQLEGLRHVAHAVGFRDGRTYARKGHTAIVLKQRAAPARVETT